jgi:hypothetical protein
MVCLRLAPLMASENCPERQLTARTIIKSPFGILAIAALLVIAFATYVISDRIALSRSGDPVAENANLPDASTQPSVDTAALPANTPTPTTAPAAKKKSKKKSAGDPIQSSPWDQAAVETQQKAKLNSLIVQGEFEPALSAAKSYYNIVQLDETKQAVDVLADALAKTRDPATVAQFRAQQLSPATLASAGEVGASGSIFKSITVDSAGYEANIQKFRSHADSIDYQIGAGNLLLLADRPTEAKACFELALQLATKGKGGKTREVRESLQGIVRSIRDLDGDVAPADAYVLAMHQKATTAPSTDVDPPVTAAMRTAIAELKPSGLTR